MGTTDTTSRQRTVAPAPADAFAAMQVGLAAAGARGVADRTRVYRICERTVAIRTLGDELFDCTDRALAHLRDDASDPTGAELKIALWDEAACALPAAPAAHQIAADATHPFAVSPDQRFVGQRFPESIIWFDRPARSMIGSVTDSAKLSCAEIGRPAEWPMLFWLRDLGIPLVHASCVAHEGRGALFLGRGGAGKSTSSAACACAGFDFVCDDKVALTPDGDGFVAHGLNGTVGLDPAALAVMPKLSSHAIAPRHPIDEKWLVFVGEALPGQLRASVPINALLIPRQGAATTRATPAKAKDALLAASLSTLLWLPIDGDRSLDRLAELASRVPAYWLDLGPDPRDVPDCVARLLQTSRAS